MLTDLVWAQSTRKFLKEQFALMRQYTPRATIYSSTTAALLWQLPGAIRFDAPSAGNRPGRHGLWQRPLERRRLRQAPLLLPWSEGAIEEIPLASRRPLQTLVLPVPVERSGSLKERDIAAITYAANPSKKGLDRVLEAWQRARRPDEELVVAGAGFEQLERAGLALPAEGVRVTGPLAPEDYRGLLRRARVFVCAPRREDYGIAQLEALIDGCQLVSNAAPGPYAALPLARELDPRLIGDDLAGALRVALDDPVDGYAERALAGLESFSRASCDRLVAEELLPRLLD
jgi:glycosyltransferase involved in cell wall biosynthesis